MDITEPTATAWPDDDVGCEAEGCAGQFTQGRDYLCERCADAFDQARDEAVQLGE
ncbi:hypothetical protein [Streptomyces sp. CBMA152]|uniref:hypothetical protein n=1 Tax=Streptomyces sp. CBMA152 TaxID=1896312 RepID=UPI0016612BA6|nr:hypothetical protein [Streptomyces sp. CBMA152]